MSKAKLIAAMHAACGCQAKNATDWLSAAQRIDALGAAFRVVYGKRLPARQKLGQDFSEWAGRAYGELRLISIFDSNKKASRYAVETQAESEAREAEENNKETRQEIIDAEKEQRAIARALKKADEAEAKKRDAEELATVAELTIEVVQPKPVVEYETTTRVDQSTGRVIETPIMGRDGQPIKKHPAHVPPEEKPAEPERPKTRVEEMRERYLRHHFPECEVTTAAGGFSNPGGIVSHNMSTERINTDPHSAWRYGGPNWTKRL